MTGIFLSAKIEITALIIVTMHAVRECNGDYSITTTDGDINVYLPIKYNPMAFELYLTVRNGILYGLARPAAHCFALYEIYMRSFRTIDTICRCGRSHDRIKANRAHVRDEPAFNDVYGHATITVDWDNLGLTQQPRPTPSPNIWFWGVISTYSGMRRVCIDSVYVSRRGPNKYRRR